MDHSFQNTVSAIRTIESLLNLPPMCQYDAASGVIGGWDDAPRNREPFRAMLPAPGLLRERNPAARSPAAPTAPRPASMAALGRPACPLPRPTLQSAEDLAHASEAMDFGQADRAPAELLNRIIWKTVKGVASEARRRPHRHEPWRASGRGRLKHRSLAPAIFRQYWGYWGGPAAGDGSTAREAAAAKQTLPADMPAYTGSASRHPTTSLPSQMAARMPEPLRGGDRHTPASTGRSARRPAATLQPCHFPAGSCAAAGPHHR